MFCPNAPSGRGFRAKVVVFLMQAVVRLEAIAESVEANLVDPNVPGECLAQGYLNRVAIYFDCCSDCSLEADRESISIDPS